MSLDSIERRALEFTLECERLRNRVTSMNGTMQASFWLMDGRLDRIDRTLDKIADAQQQAVELIAELVSRQGSAGPG